MSQNLQGDPPFSRFTRQAGRVVESVTQGYCGFVGSDPTWTPCVNLYETDDAYRVCVDLAGVQKEAIDVSVRPPSRSGEPVRLVVRGQRPVPQSPVAAPVAVGAATGTGTEVHGQERSRVHRMEIDHGAFVREVELPNNVNKDAISATYRAGLLWVELPKSE